MNYGLTKSERLNSQLVIDKLFAGGNASMAAFPLRIVYMQMEKDEHPPVSILVSVPKKRFRQAVDRNRMKRLVREAYRLNKHILWNALEGKTSTLPSHSCVSPTLCPLSTPSIRVSRKHSPE